MPNTHILGISEESLARAVALMRAGMPIAYPTDTVYGLGASGFDPSGVEAVFQAKGRSSGVPVPLLIAEPQSMADCAVDIPEVAWRLANVFWPGALTIVLRKSERLPIQVVAGGPTVALRVPAHEVPRQLSRSLGAPITGTSANISGGGSPVTAQEVLAQLRGRIDLILDGGPCRGGLPSTIVDLSGSVPRLLRQGAVAAKDIGLILGTELVVGARTET